MIEREAADAAIAALLAETLAAKDWWDKFAESPGARQWEHEMTETALRLYSRTAPVVEASLHSEMSAVYRAVGVIREIADAAAMRSCVWDFGGEHPPVPTRAGIELFIRLYDVDNWAEEQGHPLELESEGIPEEVWPDGETRDPSEGELAEVWTTVAEVFDRFVDMQEDIVDARDEHRRPMREGACALIYGARSWASWARRVAPTDGEGVVVSAQLMAQAIYTAASQESVTSPLFPSRGFVRELLTTTGGLDWLLEHQANLPDWLA